MSSLAPQTVQQYDRYGNFLPTRYLGEENDKSKYDKFSLYNMTSSYLKQLPATEKSEQIRAMIELRRLIADGGSLEKVPTLAMIHRAIEMKQILKLNELKFAKKFQEPYFQNLNSGVYKYFNMDKAEYESTRQISNLPTNNVMYMPVEVITQDSLFSCFTVELPSPTSKVMGQVSMAEDENNFVCWNLIGYVEYPEFEPAIKQFEARVLMLGSGKMALSRTAHKMNWQKDNTLQNFNEQVLLMKKNYKNIQFNPLHDSGYMPYVPQKGVYAEWSIKNKPTYGNDNIANSSVYIQGNSRGVLKPVTDNSGQGIICFCDKLNIIAAHKFESSSHDNNSMSSMRKIELIFTRIIIPRQKRESWPDIWDAIACSELQSDRLYEGITYMGPNFNPRPESVQVINPVEELIPNASAAPPNLFNKFAHERLSQFAKDHNETISDIPVPPPPPQAEDNNIFSAPAGKIFYEYLSTNKRNTIFGSGTLPEVSDTSDFSQVLMDLALLINHNLVHGDRKEEMYSRFEVSNQAASHKIPGIEYQFVYNKRFEPFIKSGMWSMSKLFEYSKNGISDEVFKGLVEPSKLVTVNLEGKVIKTFPRRGDYFRFMYGCVYNGDAYNMIVESLAKFIDYHSYALAEKTVLIPTYDSFTEKRVEIPWFGKVGQTYKSKPIVEFGLTPTKQQRILAYEGFLTWLCMMTLHLTYMNHDSVDITGVQGAQQKIQDFLSSPPVKSITKCDANLRSFMLYFFRLHDSPLMCQYGEISGLDPTNPDFVPHNKENESYKAARFAFRGDVVVKPTKFAQINDYWQLHPLTFYSGHPDEYKTQYYQLHYVLRLTYTEVLNRTDLGRQLIKINEIFRGADVARDLAGSMCSHTMGDTHEDNVFVLATHQSIRDLFGVLEEGPTREYPIEVIKFMAITTYDMLEGMGSNLVDSVNDDEAIKTEVDRFASDMLAKLGVWTYNSYFRGLNPKHNKNNEYEFTGQQYTNEDLKKDYDVPTRYLATSTINCSDFVLGSGVGPSVTKGTDMYFINKYYPGGEVLSSRSDAFRTVFKQSNDQGYNYLSVYRPFGKGIWINDKEVEIQTVLAEKWSFIGNRRPVRASLRSDD